METRKEKFDEDSIMVWRTGPVFEWKCIVCFEDMDIQFEDGMHLPCLNGAHIELSFGYGSENDGYLDDAHMLQASICDECLRSRMHLIREIRKNVVYSEICRIKAKK